MTVTANDIRAAATALEGQVIRTPMLAAPFCRGNLDAIYM